MSRGGAATQGEAGSPCAPPGSPLIRSERVKSILRRGAESIRSGGNREHAGARPPSGEGRRVAAGCEGVAVYLAVKSRRRPSWPLHRLHLQLSPCHRSVSSSKSPSSSPGNLPSIRSFLIRSFIPLVSPFVSFRVSPGALLPPRFSPRLPRERSLNPCHHALATPSARVPSVLPTPTRSVGAVWVLFIERTTYI